MKSALTAFTALLLLAAAAPAHAQATDADIFIKAVRERNGNTVTRMIQLPGSRVIQARDEKTGETALHIAAARADETWLRFLIAAGADLNALDNAGRTPLYVAVGTRSPDIVKLLAEAGADLNRGDRQGQTPLMRTVLARDLATARVLAEKGADADRTDIVSGQSARSLARRDPRAAAFVALFDSVKASKPAKTYGPKF